MQQLNSTDSFFRKFIYGVFLLLPLLVYSSVEYSEFEMPKLLFVAGASVFLACGLLINAFKAKNSYFLIKTNPIQILVILFLISVLISFFANGALEISFWGFNAMQIGSTYTLISLAVFGFLSAHWFQQEQHTEAFVKVLLFGGCLVAVIALIEYFFKFNLILLSRIGYDHTRAISSIGISITMGMLVGLLAIVAGIQFATQPKFHWFYFVSFFILVFGVFVSGSRAPIYSFAVLFPVFMVALWFRFRKELDQNFLKRQVLAGLIIALVSIVTFTYSRPTVLRKSTASQVGLGFSVRVEYWKVALDIFKENPLVGVGPENFMAHFRKLMPVSHNNFETWKNAANKAHNEPLQILSTQGILGFSIYLLLHLFVFYLILRFLIKKPKPNGFLIYSLGAGFLYLFICNLVGFNLVYTQVLFFVVPLLMGNLEDVLSVTLELKARIYKFLVVAMIVALSLGTAGYAQQYLGYHEYRLATTAIADGDYVQAFDRINKALFWSPNKYFLYCGRARIVMLAYSYQETKNHSFDSENQQKIFKDVDSDIETCSQLGKGIFDLYFDLGQFYSVFYGKRPEYVDRGIIALEEAMKVYPKNPNNCLNLAIFYRQKGDFQTSSRYIDEALKLKPDYTGAILERYLMNYQIGTFKQNHELIEQLKSQILQFKKGVDFKDTVAFLIQNMINESKAKKDQHAIDLIKELVKIYDSSPE